MGTERAVGWAALDTAVLQWVAGGGSPELGAAVGPAEMRSASIELARRVDAIRDFVADGVGVVGVRSVRVPLAEYAEPRMPPAAQTGPEVTPAQAATELLRRRAERADGDPGFVAVHAASYGTGGKCLRCGRWATPGTECVSPEAVAARHQATIDKAFAQGDTLARDRYGDDAIDKLNRLQAEGTAAIEPLRVGDVYADPALRMDRWPLDELDWLERRADYLSNQLNEFNRRLRTLLRRVRG